MFVTIISKRIKSKKQEDWYVLASTVLPFAPTLGMKIFIPPKAILTITSILWDSHQGCFHLMAGEHNAEKGSTESEAKKLIKLGPWTEAAPESTVNEAEHELVKKTVAELKSTILRAQTAQNLNKLTPQMLKNIRLSHGPRKH